MEPGHRRSERASMSSRMAGRREASSIGAADWIRGFLKGTKGSGVAALEMGVQCWSGTRGAELREDVGSKGEGRGGWWKTSYLTMLHCWLCPVSNRRFSVESR